jgi:hypothetical protein
LVLFLFVLLTYCTTRVQTRIISCLLRNLARQTSRKERKIIGIVFFCIIDVLYNTGTNINNFMSTVQFSSRGFEKEKKENGYFFVCITDVLFNSGANENNFVSTAQFCSRSFEKG